MESEYIIVYDENGEPHLEHAWLRRGQAHKYIMKIGEGLKARYFYTQAEVDAYMNRGKQKLKNAVGADERDRLDAAKKDLSIAKEKSDRANRRLTRANDKAAEIDSYGQRWFKTEKQAREAGDAELKAVRSANDVKNKEKSVEYYKDRYDKTPLGKAENAKETVKSAAQRLNENTKSKMDKMREEFRKGADSVKDTAKEKVQEIKDNKQAKKEAQEKANKEAENRRNIDHNEHWKALDREDSILDRANGLTGLNSKVSDDDQLDAYKIKREISGLKKDYLDGKIDINERNAKLDAAEKKLDQIEAKNEKKEARENNRKSRSSEEKSNEQSKTKFSMYSKGDPDFNDDNFKEEDRIGDTDFFAYQRPDGTSVIVEEDMKWELPKGVSAKDPEIKKAIADFADHVSSARSIGKPTYTSEEWERDATKAISDAAEKALSKYPDQSTFRRSSQKEANNTKGYKKKPDPTDASGFISFDTLKSDAKEAEVDFSAYESASNKFYRIQKEKMREYEEKRNTRRGPESGVTPMFYTDPEYIKARDEYEKEEKKLKDKLYE